VPLDDDTRERDAELAFVERLKQRDEVIHQLEQFGAWLALRGMSCEGQRQQQHQ